VQRHLLGPRCSSMRSGSRPTSSGAGAIPSTSNTAGGTFGHDDREGIRRPTVGQNKYSVPASIFTTLSVIAGSQA
jgi:hypothetical protein